MNIRGFRQTISTLMGLSMSRGFFRPWYQQMRFPWGALWVEVENVICFKCKPRDLRCQAVKPLKREGAQVRVLRKGDGSELVTLLRTNASGLVWWDQRGWLCYIMHKMGREPPSCRDGPDNIISKSNHFRRNHPLLWLPSLPKVMDHWHQCYPLHNSLERERTGTWLVLPLQSVAYSPLVNAAVLIASSFAFVCW